MGPQPLNHQLGPVGGTGGGQSGGQVEYAAGDRGGVLDLARMLLLADIVPPPREGTAR